MKFTTGCQHLLIDDNERWWFLSNHFDTFLNPRAEAWKFDLCQYWLIWCEKRTTPLNNIGTQNDATFESGDTSTIYQLYIHHQIVWKQLHIINVYIYIQIYTNWSLLFGQQLFPFNRPTKNNNAIVLRSKTRDLRGLCDYVRHLLAVHLAPWFTS